MSFWSKLFGKNNIPDERELLQRTREFLQHVEQLASHDPKSAMKLIKGKSKFFQPVIRIGGILHEEFRKVVFSIKPRIDPSKVPFTSLSVAIVSWNKVDNIGELVRFALGVKEDLLYIIPVPAIPKRKEFVKIGTDGISFGVSTQKDDVDALSEVEALYGFSSDPRVVMALLTDMRIIFRKSFILMAEELDPDIEEVGQELLDFANAKDLTVLCNFR
jgi:DNA-directed RNA polymerase subunit F